MSRDKTNSRRLSFCLALLLLSCNGGSKGSETHDAAKLGAGVLARVGPLSIGQDEWGILKQGATVDLEVLVSDTLLSLESTRLSPHRAAVIRRAGRARALMEELERATLRATPLSSSELDSVRDEYWLRFDRPRAVRSAVIRVPVPALADDAPYRDLAARLHAAASETHNLQGLLLALDRVDTDLEVQRMRMPPVAADGRVVPILPQDHEMERVQPSLAEHVSALQQPGEVSPIFAGPDSYQFVFAIEIIEEERASGESARQQMRKLALARRLKEPLAGIKDVQKANLSYSRKELGALLGLVWRK